MRLIDTCIFIYAAGKSHPHQERSFKLIEEVLTNSTGYNISTEILQEILHVYINKKQREKGIKLVESLMQIFPQPFAISNQEILTACMFLKNNAQLGARDALHAAVVKNHGLEGIISFDVHFDQLKEIKRYIP